MSKKRSKLGWPKVRNSTTDPKSGRPGETESSDEVSAGNSGGGGPGTPDSSGLGGGDSAKPSSSGLPDLFERPKWRSGMNVFGAMIIACFNIALIGGDLHMKHPNFTHMLFGYLLLFVLDVTWLLPIVLEVDRAEIKDDRLTIKTLLWRRTYDWTDFTSFTDISYLKFAALRTRRCCYLINRRHFANYDVLAANLRKHLPLPPPKAKT